MVQITSGTGKRNAAEVTDDFKLATRAENTNVFNKLGTEGLGWSVITSTFTLTGTGQSEIVYIKNDSEDGGLLLRDATMYTGLSNESTGTNNPIQNYSLDLIVPAVSNAATPIIPGPMRSSKAGTLGVTVNEGGDGVAVVPAVTVANLPLRCGALTTFYDGDTILFVEQGDFFSLAITPPAGNTSLEVAISFSIFKNDGRL